MNVHGAVNAAADVEIPTFEEYNWETDYRNLINNIQNNHRLPFIVFEVWDQSSNQWIEKLFLHHVFHLAHEPPYMRGFNALECEGRHNPIATEGNPVFFRWPEQTVDNSPNKNILYNNLNALITSAVTEYNLPLKEAQIARLATLPIEYKPNPSEAAPKSPQYGGRRRRRRHRKRKSRRRKKRTRRRRRRRRGGQGKGVAQSTVRARRRNIRRGARSQKSSRKQIHARNRAHHARTQWRQQIAPAAAAQAANLPPGLVTNGQVEDANRMRAQLAAAIGAMGGIPGLAPAQFQQVNVGAAPHQQLQQLAADSAAAAPPGGIARAFAPPKPPKKKRWEKDRRPMKGRKKEGGSRRRTRRRRRRRRR